MTFIRKLRFLEIIVWPAISLHLPFSRFILLLNPPFLSTVYFMALPYFTLKFLPNQLGSLPREIRTEVHRLVLSLYARAISGPSYSYKVRLMDRLLEISCSRRKPFLVQIQPPNINSSLSLT